MLQGATIGGHHFLCRGMGSAGVEILTGATIDRPPNEPRYGTFAGGAPNGALLRAVGRRRRF